jgi:hypothetical protein
MSHGGTVFRTQGPGRSSTYRPASSRLVGRRMDSDMGVAKNMSVRFAARSRKVEQKSRESAWITSVVTSSGFRNSSSRVVVFAAMTKAALNSLGRLGGSKRIRRADHEDRLPRFRDRRGLCMTGGISLDLRRASRAEASPDLCIGPQNGLQQMTYEGRGHVISLFNGAGPTPRRRTIGEWAGRRCSLLSLSSSSDLW